MAPPRKAPRLKLLAGTQRPDRAPTSDPTERLVAAPPPPKHLVDRAAAEWCRLAPAVVGIGTLTGADLRALELLAQTLATESEAAELLARDGLTAATGNGGLKSHPAVRIMETARSQARALLADFGLTPRGRQSVETVAPHTPGSPFDEFMK